MPARHMSVLFPVLLLSAVAGFSQVSDEQFRQERTLSLLRGTWETHSFYDSWSLSFEGDGELYLNHEPATYSYASGAVRVDDGDGTKSYRIWLDGNKLTLQLPEGGSRTYNRKSAGLDEQGLYGAFYFPVNSDVPDDTLTFNGDYTFTAHGYASDFGVETESDTEDVGVRAGGVYRIENESIVLVFDNGNVIRSRIRLYDFDDNVASFSANGRVFARLIPRKLAHDYSPVVIGEIPPPPVGYPPPDPPWCPPIIVDPAPGCPPHYPSPESPSSPSYPTGSASTSPAPAQHVSSPPRDFGSQRGGATAPPPPSAPEPRPASSGHRR